MEYLENSGCQKQSENIQKMDKKVTIGCKTIYATSKLNSNK